MATQKSLVFKDGETFKISVTFFSGLGNLKHFKSAYQFCYESVEDLKIRNNLSLFTSFAVSSNFQMGSVSFSPFSTRHVLKLVLNLERTAASSSKVRSWFSLM